MDLTFPPGHRDRSSLVRWGRRLAWFTIAWNALEGVVAIISGMAARSIALIGFGADSYVEVFAGSVIVWRLAKEGGGEEVSEDAERLSVRLIAVTFFLLAVGVGLESLRELVTTSRPEKSLPGIVLAVVSLIVMPLLAWGKRRVGEQLGSQAVRADATETILCVWLSAILLVGLGLNALLGWWWADPVAALGVVYVAMREGIENWSASKPDPCC